MSAPIIGITTYSHNATGDYTLPAPYVEAVRQAGGIPILLPPGQADPSRLLKAIDGLVFSGGGDIDPALYSGATHPTIYSIDLERDRFELELATAALKSAVPVLGICRGMQVLSVASGAALIPHVPDVYGEQITHRLDHPRRPIEHLVQIKPDSRLANILQTAELTVVSWHHQAIQTAPAGWQIMATAADGLIEAIESTQHAWMIAVQWHPELSPVDSEHARLFAALVKASGK